MRSAYFTLDYANTSTSLHNDLKAMATNQVGFLRNNFDVEVFLSVTQVTWEEHKSPNSAQLDTDAIQQDKTLRFCP